MIIQKNIYVWNNDSNCNIKLSSTNSLMLNRDNKKTLGALYHVLKEKRNLDLCWILIKPSLMVVY